MKRDMDLIRAMLMILESPGADPIFGPLAENGYSEEQIGYHAWLLHDAGLARGWVMECDGSLPSAQLQCLTWAGQEFLAAARKDSVWNKAKQRALDTVGDLSLETMKAALSFVAQKAITGDWTS